VEGSGHGLLKSPIPIFSALVGTKYLWELTFVTLTSIRIDTTKISIKGNIRGNAVPTQL
jgi:hypothetical protein